MLKIGSSVNTKQSSGCACMQIAHPSQYLSVCLKLCEKLASVNTTLLPITGLACWETGEKIGILRHTGCAWSVALIGLWTNWTIPFLFITWAFSGARLSTVGRKSWMSQEYSFVKSVSLFLFFNGRQGAQNWGRSNNCCAAKCSN